MKTYPKTYLISFFLAAFLLLTCTAPKNSYVSKPVRSATNADEDLLQTDVAALHINDTVTTLFIQIENEKLLYRRNDTGVAFQARLNLRVLLFADGNEKRCLDSSNRYITDISVSEKVLAKKIQVSIDCKTPGGLYQAALEFYDLNRHVMYQELVKIDHRKPFNAQNFLALKNDTVAYKSYFSPKETLRILAPTLNSNSIFVNVYTTEFGPALPPFSTRDDIEQAPKPDTTFEVAVTNSMALLQMPEKGALIARAGKESKEGLCLFVTDEAFPGITSNLEMIQCTRYIMSKDEYEACLSAADQKIAIDNFWIGIGGSKERARELVRRYYGRVKDANKLYSSFLPGWKTDRGMIYIVLGAPFSKYFDRNGEVWVYGNDANPNSLRFVFKLRKDALTPTDYVLERSVFYRDPFHNAVEFWRQGIVFNEFKR